MVSKRPGGGGKLDIRSRKCRNRITRSLGMFRNRTTAKLLLVRVKRGSQVVCGWIHLLEDLGRVNVASSLVIH